LVQHSDFYDVTSLTDRCDEYLFNCYDLTVGNIFDMVEFVEKYSLPKYTSRIDYLISSDISTFTNSEQFLNAKKSVVQAITAYTTSAWQNDNHDKELLKAVYKWGEHQAMAQYAKDGKCSINEAIKDQLTGVLERVQERNINW
jgi:hypothetical protein